MEIFLFARFQAKAGNENAVERALRTVIAPTREEAGCLSIHIFRSTRDPKLFYIHSRWKDEAAFELHATLPHTVQFLGTVEPLLEHPPEVTRSVMIA